MNVSLKICVTDNYTEKESAHMWLKKFHELKPESNKVMKTYEINVFKYWKSVQDSNP